MRNRARKEEKVYGAALKDDSNDGIWWAVRIGGGVLLLFVLCMFLFMFRGQQTGSQRTTVGVAEANRYKGLPSGLQTLVTSGSDTMNVIN
jgi:hypothetical protein